MKLRMPRRALQQSRFGPLFFARPYTSNSLINLLGTEGDDSIALDSSPMMLKNLRLFENALLLEELTK
jgi:hypothetical protein